MSHAALALLVLNFIFIGVLPRIFFRSDGTFNLRWWATAAPFFIAPTALVLGHFGYLSPIFYEGAMTRELIAVVLSTCSIGLIGLTIGTNRVPLALWHQENDAPKGVVTYGAYRYVRHPFYCSFLLGMLAAFLLFPHWMTLGLVLYMFIGLNVTAAREEKRLAASEFGKEYQSYLTRTGRFFPKILG